MALSLQLNGLIVAYKFLEARRNIAIGLVSNVQMCKCIKRPDISNACLERNIRMNKECFHELVHKFRPSQIGCTVTTVDVNARKRRFAYTKIRARY